MQQETINKISEDERKLVWLLATLVATHAEGVADSEAACDWGDEVLKRYEGGQWGSEQP